MLIVLLFLVWIGFRVLRIVQARRNAAKVMQSLAEVSAPDAASVATAEELATLKQRMDEALALLKRAKLGGSERRNLYELPWYVIIGPPGSGKTTALMNSGLDFPLAAQMGAGAIRGVGGTRNCDWWFTDEAVLLDTAGRYTTQDSHAQVDKAAWLGFLDLLKTQRKRRPSMARSSPSAFPTCCWAATPSAPPMPRRSARASRSCTSSSGCASRST